MFRKILFYVAVVLAVATGNEKAEKIESSVDLESDLQAIYSHPEAGPILRHMATYSRPMPISDGGYFEAASIGDLEKLGRLKDRNILRYADDFEFFVNYHRRKYGVDPERYDAMVSLDPSKRFRVLDSTKPEPFRIHK